MKKKYPISPMGKPRMVCSDKWKKRPCVERYWDFKDQCKKSGLTLGERGYHITFYMPMPKSWPMKRKMEMAGQPHRQKPDVDNMLKAIMDAVYSDDSVVYDIRVSKYWDWSGSIVVDDWCGES